MKTLNDFDVDGKKILVRCDFNVPLRNGIILDDFRIRKTIPTVRYLIKKDAKIILMSHLGRPNEVKDKKLRIKNFSLKPVAKELEKILKRKVKFLPDCIGEKIENEINKMRPKDIILLENLRFYGEEEKNDEKFAESLSKLGDVFINDAFACSHRAHASIAAITRYLPSGTGLLLEQEIENLNKIVETPNLPLVAVFGGKEADFQVIERFSKIAQFVLVGHLVHETIKPEERLLKFPQRIIAPIDGIHCSGESCDIGPRTIDLFKRKISQAKTIFWSGPLGKIEDKKFQTGTREIAETIIKSKAFSVAGGGETIDFVNDLGFSRKFNHLSTGGTAMLEFLSGEKLPGLDVLGYYGN